MENSKINNIPDYLQTTQLSGLNQPGILFQANSPSFLESPFITTPVDNLNRDLENLHNQITQLQSEVAGKRELEKVNQRVDKMVKSIESATEQGHELKAKVLLPPSEYLNIQLVPSHTLERLEEYRTDEKKIFVLLGSFLGSILGILSNWATQKTFAMNRASWVLLTMCIIVTILSTYYAWIISGRVKIAKSKLFIPRNKDIEIAKQAEIQEKHS